MSPYTLEDKKLLQLSVISGNKGKLEGCSIYYSGVYFSYRDAHTRKKPYKVKIMLGNLSHL